MLFQGWLGVIMKYARYVLSVSILFMTEDQDLDLDHASTELLPKPQGVGSQKVLHPSRGTQD